ncbi:MAG TPA: MauE/DoxX family redox-associated membrane protein [Mycobacteriales bacterium]|nr:MauE/DoxX family redox-associated membrane protein [Mycobacteriales bacterium]
MTLRRRLRRASPYLLALLLGAAGVNHFVHPDAYDRIVPEWLPATRAITYGSGVAELVCAALVLVPATRRVGGWATVGLFVLVFPANVVMALDGGLPGSASFTGSATAAWLRLPLQVPLVWWAVTVARDPRQEASPAQSRQQVV